MLGAMLCGDAVTLQVFCLRSMASGAAFHRAYPRATQQAFLEAHEGAFLYFGGVHATLRYDNLTSAVRKILRGFRREDWTRLAAAAGIPAEIRWAFPFRWIVSHRR